MKGYETYTLPNGLRLIHAHQTNAVSYCGVIVDFGSRDEDSDASGMAHLIEHMLFKGTNKRSSIQIINRLENVGGELNAYTSKEETVIYAAVLTEYTERAVELIADMVQNSSFPAEKIHKEIPVILDEIQLYNDSPAELIFDDFEEMMFPGSPLGHSVLGSEESLIGIERDRIVDYFNGYYQPDNMVFFSSGNHTLEQLKRWTEKHFSYDQVEHVRAERKVPERFPEKFQEINRDTHQVHAIIGGRAYNYYHKERLSLYMLNNILGGPGMNSLLNIALREKNGLVYSVESVVQTYTDTGWWGIYFGTDPENYKKCERLVKRELDKLQNNLIHEAKLKKYKEQLRGQLAVSNENRENLTLAMGKSYMRFGKFDSLEEMQEKIMKITSHQLRDVARELFHEENRIQLKYF